MVGEIMNIYVIICIIVALIASIIIFLINIYNKYQWVLIKIKKGENNIESFLNIKYDTLMRYFEFLKSNITVDEDDFEEYKLFNTEVSINKLNDKIIDLKNLINRYMDNNEDLYKNETITKINEELYNINLSINSSKKYYNEHVAEYNNLCQSYPSKIIANIFKYKTKSFIDEDAPDNLKILNQEEQS